MDIKGIHINIVRSGRRTLALMVRPDGTVEARAPYAMSTEQIERFVRSKAD